ncbi:acetoacetate decarboxylase family protein [Leptolyngbya ohadii]|uniref:acetoacetate decarboxylase family protein n=1 Tax=Leptolyngbya ohadii TaxID=1962290 RepID=UPI000B599075|nr:acetoacetate decarboxylase family protein [Leptolyngbya ohadii]
MSYPSTPWQLQGYALQTLNLIDIDRVRPLIPSELEIIPVFPGKTIGGVYLSAYKSGSVLQYNELIVVSGLIYHAGTIGGWVSHIYVDNPDSIAGGREIWGLPKEYAEFKWQQGEQLSVEVTQGEDVLCRCRCTWKLPGLPLALSAPVFSVKDTKLLLFEGQTNSPIHIAGVDLQIPESSPFAWLNIGQPWLGAYVEPLFLKVNAPRVIQERSRSFSYS